MATPTASRPLPCHEDPELGEREFVIPAEHDFEQQEGQRLALMPADIADRMTAGALRKSAFYPPANKTKLYFGDTLSAANFTWIRAVLLHSTETANLPGYQGGKSAPNLTGVPNVARRRIDWFHHYRLNQSSRALKNLDGGVQTNLSNIVQAELVGTTAKGGPGMFLPNAPDWWHKSLAAFLDFMHDEWGVPLVSTVSWKSYPPSYGRNNGVRLEGPRWLGYHGILAHQHAAENDHGDVLLDITKTLRFARGNEDDMPLNADDKGWISAEVAKQVAANNDDLIRTLLRTDLGKVGGNDSVQVALQDSLAQLRRVGPIIDNIQTQLNARGGTDAVQGDIA